MGWWCFFFLVKVGGAFQLYDYYHNTMFYCNARKHHAWVQFSGVNGLVSMGEDKLMATELKFEMIYLTTEYFN